MNIASAKVLVSILNWNGAQKTLKCLESMRQEVAQAPCQVTVLVIDNGSRTDDVAMLAAHMPPEFLLQRQPENLGFTGGHNIAIEFALGEAYDFIWLLNNDAVVDPGCLRELVAAMATDERCGAVSPVLRDLDDGHVVRCVNVHDWASRKSKRIACEDEARRVQAEQPDLVWVDGTAVLFRVEALKATGGLDDRLFAYFDDNDIGARLADRGWYSRCAYGATVYHENRKHFSSFPLYLIYLYHRNEMLFYEKNTPLLRRPALWFRMTDQALFDANRLYRSGYAAQANVMLLALQDFWLRKFGPPAHDRKVPFLTRLASRLAGRMYAKKIAAMPPYASAS